MILQRLSEYFGVSKSVFKRKGIFDAIIGVDSGFYLDPTLLKNTHIPEFKGAYAKVEEHYKKALLEQAIYIWRNGDMSVDSGYDLESGEKISRGKIKQISIASNTIDHLRMCGLWNRTIARTFWGPFGI